MRSVYHADLPKYVRRLTEDDGLEPLTWKAMLVFYGQMDRIYVPSRYYRNQLAEQGFDPVKLHVLPRGVDTERFSRPSATRGCLSAMGSMAG